jgi:hypothetical protein
VNGGQHIQSIPSLIFALLLLGIAIVATRITWPAVWALWGFFLLDWSLMAALPALQISYGPAKPPTLLLAILRAAFALFPSPWIWILQSIGTLLVVYAFWIEPQRLVVTKQHLSTEKLDLMTPIRILHFGDLHVERITKREQKLIEMARSLEPDLILFSGDVLSYSNIDDGIAQQEARAVLSQIASNQTIYAVAGSPPVDRKDVLVKIYNGLSITLLETTRVQLQLGGNRMTLTGLPCTHDPEHDGAELRKLPPVSKESFDILLYHSPDLAPTAAELGYDLQLSGHTHGGQVRLPLYGALYTSSLLGKRYEAGRYQVGDMTLYVTRGLGLEGKAAPRVRFLCSPEIVLWEIGGRIS